MAQHALARLAGKRGEARKSQFLVTPISNMNQPSNESWTYNQKNRLESTIAPKLNSAEYEIRPSANEPVGNSAANLPHAWCPRCQSPDDATSDDARGALADREASIETSLTRSIRRQQSCQQTENGPVAVEAHWRANPLHQGYPEGVLNRDEVVALINYDSLKQKRLH